MDVRGRVCRAEGIRGGIGLADGKLEHLLCVLEVEFPFFPSPFELWQPFKFRSLVRESFFCKEGAVCHGNKPLVRDGKSGSRCFMLCFLTTGDEFRDSRVFDPPGLHPLLDAYHVDSLSARASCSEVVEEIVEDTVLEKGGLIFQANHPRFFHVGVKGFLSHVIGGLDCRLSIKLAGPYFSWRRRTTFLSSSLMEGS